MQPLRFLGFFSGLSRVVLLWFLFIALAPITLVSWLSYQNAQEGLFQDTQQHLLDLAELQVQNIRTNFERLMVDLGNEAERESNSHFLQLLVDDFRNSGQKAVDYTRSFRWAMLVDEHTADLRTFWNAYGYHDILMVDLDGNLLFNFTQESDLGQNLWSGELSNTHLARAAERALATGEASFSDLERYAPSHNKIVGFVMAPLLDGIGEKIGLIVFQLSRSQLHQLEGESPRFGKSGRRYLIGEDMRLRTSGALDERYPVLERKVLSDNTRKWHQMHIELKQKRVADEHREAYLYTGPYGESVIGVHASLNIADVHWGYIIEIDTAEALAASNRLAELTLALMALMALLVLLIALPVTRSIVRPIVEISSALEQVGQGNLQPLQIRARHELGALVGGFNEMIHYLQFSEQRTNSQHWKQEGANQLMDKMQGDQGLPELSRNTVTFLCNYLQAQIGAFYVVRSERIQLTGSYAFRARKGFHNEFGLGEGMVGQAALEQQTLLFSDVPQDYLAVGSGLGETTPSTISVIPLLWNSEVVALLELGTMAPLSELQEQFLEIVAPSIAVAIQTSLSRERTQELLVKTQAQSEKLRVREEELRESNTSLRSCCAAASPNWRRRTRSCRCSRRSCGLPTRIWSARREI